MQNRTKATTAVTLTLCVVFGVFWLVNQDTARPTQTGPPTNSELVSTTVLLTTAMPTTTTTTRPPAPMTTKPLTKPIDPEIAFSQTFEDIQVAVTRWYTDGGTLDAKLKALNQSVLRVEKNYSHIGAKIRMSYATGDDPVWKVVLSGESRCMVEDLSGPSLVLRPTSC
jgi:hypothetical protein